MKGVMKMLQVAVAKSWLLEGFIKHPSSNGAKPPLCALLFISVNSRKGKRKASSS
jgi:hypothetical protein